MPLAGALSLTSSPRRFSSDPPGTDNPQRDYIQMLATMENTTQSTVYVDFQHVSVFNDVLAGTIEDSFYRYEPALRRALGNIIAKYYPNMLKNKSSRPADRWTAFWVGFRNVAAFNKVRDLKTDKIGQLLSVSGTVTRTSEVRPELISGRGSTRHSLHPTHHPHPHLRTPAPSPPQPPLPASTATARSSASSSSSSTRSRRRAPTRSAWASPL